MKLTEELRAAAERLRWQARAAQDGGSVVYYDAPDAVIGWHATMHPLVGLALAEWLDIEARHHDAWVDRGNGERGRNLRAMFAEDRFNHALAVARLINGGTQ